MDAVFDKNDGDGDGRMTKEEFHNFMEKGKQHKQNQPQTWSMLLLKQHSLNIFYLNFIQDVPKYQKKIKITTNEATKLLGFELFSNRIKK